MQSPKKGRSRVPSVGRLEFFLRVEGKLDHALEQFVGALGAVVVEDCLQRLEPLGGLGRVAVVVEDVVQPAVAHRVLFLVL